MNCAGIYDAYNEEGRKYLKECRESKDNKWPDWYTKTVAKEGWCLGHHPNYVLHDSHI